MIKFNLNYLNFVFYPSTHSMDNYINYFINQLYLNFKLYHKFLCKNLNILLNKFLHLHISLIVNNIFLCCLELIIKF